MKAALILSLYFASTLECTLAFKNSDEWFTQWKMTDQYRASDGTVNRIPLRLTSQETVIYGPADLDAVLPDFEDEEWTPLTVGGKVPVQIWLNNFTDSDCGPDNQVNPYHETWFSLSVTKKSAPVNLPYNASLGPFNWLSTDPSAKVFVMRVICGTAFGDTTQPMAAISGGREVWGFPKSNKMAEIRYDYDGNYTNFNAEHGGKPVISARVLIPEALGVAGVPAEVTTAKDACVTPRWSPKQSIYGEAFKATMYTAPWDNTTDSLVIHSGDGWYGDMLARWNFQPALKMHSTDFKIAAFKPAGWL